MRFLLVLITSLFFYTHTYGQAQYDDFLSLIENAPLSAHDETLKKIISHWDTESPLLTIEILYLLNNPPLAKKLMSLLVEKTGENYHTNFNQWYEWWWKQGIETNSEYLNFKASLYAFVDPLFDEYFYNRGKQLLIDPSEIRWGGVGQDGIPPLRQPNMISAEEAIYLDESNVIFGVYINGEAKAFPKRILAWHEMFVDQIGGVNITGVYCTLCGTVIAYDSEDFNLGTSGFLYRSNKLMYDQNTQSLWSTLDGEPVVGPLINKNIKLQYYPIVTTTWGQWKKIHPNTSVLSLETSYSRDYDEGVAYAQYFATDQLMFSVKNVDRSLDNKDEVFIVRKGEASLAISSKYLNRKNIIYEQLNETPIVIITDDSGANRAYYIEGEPFVKMKKGVLLDINNKQWEMNEEYITNGVQKYTRIPAFRAFWFGWYGAHPETRLVK